MTIKTELIIFGKPLDVQCKSIFKSGCKVSSYGHFKILAQECNGWDGGIYPELFVSSLYISFAVKVSLLIFNMFNIYKNNILEMVLVFS